MADVENIRASSGEGLPICIDSARIFSKDPEKANNVVYVAYEGKRYYAPDPMSLAQNIEAIIKGEAYSPSASPRLPQDESAARALVGDATDAVAASRRKSPSVMNAFRRIPSNFSPGKSTLGRAFGEVGSSVASGSQWLASKLPQKSAAVAPAPVANASAPAANAAAAPAEAKPAGQSWSNWAAKTFKRTPAPNQGAKDILSNMKSKAQNATQQAKVSTGKTGPSWSNRLKSGLKTARNRTVNAAKYSGRLASGVGSAIGSVGSAAIKSVMPGTAESTPRPGSVAATAPTGRPGSAAAMTPENIAKANATQAASPAPETPTPEATAAAPAGGSRRHRKRKVRPLTAPTRRAGHKVKAHK